MGMLKVHDVVYVAEMESMLQESGCHQRQHTNLCDFSSANDGNSVVGKRGRRISNGGHWRHLMLEGEKGREG